MVNGHFLMVHDDHLLLLDYAAHVKVRGEKFSKKKNYVIVAINGDYYHRQKYGDHAASVKKRRQQLLAVPSVDEVIVFNEPDPREILFQYHPDYLVKGPDYASKDIAEASLCHDLGIKIMIRPGHYILSSSDMVRRS